MILGKTKAKMARHAQNVMQGRNIASRGAMESLKKQKDLCC